MAVLLTNFCLALKDSKSCPNSIQIAEKIQSYFKADVTVFLSGNNRNGIPPIFKVEENISTKEIAKKFKSTNHELIILPVIKGDSERGLVSPAEANNIIEQVERMVLTVPCTSSSQKFDKIIVPIDSSFETRQKVPYALSLARAFGATLYVLGVSNDKGKDTTVLVNNYLRQVCNNIEEKGINFVSETRLGGNPADQILNYAKEIGACLIVIMTEQETNFTSFFSGKYSQQIVKNSEIPILAIHPKDLIVSDARL
jgi:nucleotide-binding universal stress UspA family protein